MDTEYLGKVILLFINYGLIFILLFIGIRELRRNYEFREFSISNCIEGFLFVFLFTFLWFVTPLSSLFNEYIVGKVFVDFRKSSLLQILFLLISVLLSFFYLKKWKEIVKNNYHLNLNLIIFGLGLLFFYWYYRIGFGFAGYDYFSVWDDHREVLKILDVPVVGFSIFLLLFLIHSLFKRDYKVNYEDNIVADIPLKNKEDDEYERRDFYAKLLKHIAENHVNQYKSVNIAIVNSWGEGKSSFLNFLKNDLEKDSNTIVIEFNPWHSTSSNFTFDFFQTLDEGISKYIHTGSLIRNYARSLSSIDGIFNITKYLPASWVGDRSNKEFYDNINDLVQRLGRRIVIIIDDLDRLDNKEVINALQVIRNSAGFSNCMFIVPFDKSYVLNSLKVNRIYKPEEYIKKIFDVELALPPISKLYIQKMIFEYLWKNFTDKINITEIDENNLKDQLDRLIFTVNHFGVTTRSGNSLKYYIVSKNLTKIIKNKRDLIRFSNSLMSIYTYTNSIVYLPDLLILEIIKYIDIEVYKRIFVSQDFFEIEMEGLVSKLVLNMCESENEKSNKDCFSIRHNIYKHDLRELLEALFTEPDFGDFNHINTIVNPQNFLNYIEFRSVGITQNEIDSLFE
ncbi:KAP family P-loop NTPase fold protein [Sphingobacterium humi]|uniref:AAA family ATPase n=1 Tax=Sphingobacterium humi TaxID=1796905 RepID=A0A6N8KXG4_9SPHI|nr:P-loop NTPase fold protein [Sphingobacterium humi]MVZ62163.1 AAA family ATPase [Sphingobacterium humi]